MKKKSTIAITLTSSLLATGAVQGADPANNPIVTKLSPALQAGQLAVMSKADIRKLLATLEKAQVPETKIGAMCYKPVGPPDRMEYVCPVCGEKTLYAKELSWKWTRELENCRRTFKEIPNNGSIRLDETSFCKKCQPNAKEPMLNLSIRFDDGTTNNVSNISSQDLYLLRDFFKGKLSVTGPQDETTPINKSLPRLHELLGIRPENK